MEWGGNEVRKGNVYTNNAAVEGNGPKECIGYEHMHR